MGETFLDFSREYSAPARGLGAPLRRHGFAVISVPAWTAAAGLAAASAWQAVSHAHIPALAGAPAVNLTTDGWGRDHIHSGQVASSHTVAAVSSTAGPRFGIVACACAAAFLVCAVLAGQEFVRPSFSPWPRRTLIVLSIAAPALLVGLTWAVFLTVAAALLGPFVWWCIGAVVCAAAAAAVNATDTLRHNAALFHNASPTQTPGTDP